MLNVDKYRDEIEKIGISTFSVKNGLLKPCVSVSCDLCAFHPDGKDSCDTKKLNWLLEEYKAGIDWERDIDWGKVPVDTEVYVWDLDYGEERVLKRKNFAIYLPKARYKYATFDKGKKQNDADGFSCWKFCKLANPKDVEKYKNCKEKVLKSLIDEHNETDWGKVQPHTRVKVCDSGTDDWKVGYFAFYHPELERKFWIFGPGGKDYMASGWRKCVLFPED